MLNYFANPARLTKFLERIHPALTLSCIIAFSAGVYVALIASPIDYQQGEYVRIMYIHVPAAWWSLGIYSAMAVCSFVFLVWKHPLADVVARQSAMIAIIFTIITLVTGALWGRPTWGVYWVWDARLTSMLILLFILLGYQLLASQADFHEARQKACALFCLFGALNIPVIKFSVEWWNTLHQPASMFRSNGNAIDPSMQLPLFIMAGAYFLLYCILLSLRIRSNLLQAKIIRSEQLLLRMSLKNK
jgi:heme exporter protein C